jgi:hypothetical protein
LAQEKNTKQQKAIGFPRVPSTYPLPLLSLENRKQWLTHNSFRFDIPNLKKTQNQKIVLLSNE